LSTPTKSKFTSGLSSRQVKFRLMSFELMSQNEILPGM
jgi:hypothetical protein